MRKTTPFLAMAFAAATTSTALAQDDTMQGMEQDANQAENQVDQAGNNMHNDMQNGMDNGMDNDLQNPDDVERINPDSNLFGPTQGDIEITVSGTGNNDQDFENGAGGLVLDGGYYATDAVQVGLRQTVNYADQGGNSSWNGETSAYVDYNFNIDRFRPFVGVRLGYLYGEDTNDSFIAGPEAGVKWYIKDETFIFGRATYQFVFEDTDDANEAFDDGRFVYTLGIGFVY